MNKLLLISIVTLLLFSTKKINAQEVIKLTFQEVIKLSEEQSPNALMAKHTYRASYWNYRTFVAQYRPSLTLTGTTPDYSTAYDKVWNSQFERWDYKATNIISNYSSLVLSQNIGFTGGSISLSSDLTLYNDIENNSHRFISSPINIGLTQPLFRYNALKWQKKIEPLRYQAAKKTFITSIESVHQQAVSFFFSLALAQINKQIADINYSNADTLWRISKGRYELGTIAEDERFSVTLFGGGKKEIAILKSWEMKYSGVKSVAGELSFAQELALMAGRDLMLTMDSANMHFACCMRVPVISIWGATHPYLGFYGWGQNIEMALQSSIECRPCSSSGKKECFRGDYACLNEITPDMVFKKIVNFFEQRL